MSPSHGEHRRKSPRISPPAARDNIPELAYLEPPHPATTPAHIPRWAYAEHVKATIAEATIAEADRRQRRNQRRQRALERACAVALGAVCIAAGVVLGTHIPELVHIFTR